MWSYTVTWDSEPEDVLVTATGTVTPATVAAYTKEVVADPRFRPGMRCVIDYSDADLAQLSQSDLDERLSMMSRDAQPFAGSRLAIVVARAVDFGIMRMVHTRGDLVLEREGVEIERQVFRTLAEARAWLGAIADDAPAGAA